jgi:SAM-dependent methyltransferase
MDIRDLAILGHQTLAKVNARHPWNHNEHYHGWILRNLPARRRAAVDIGCGKGVLARKLVTHFAHVTGIDRSDNMAEAASARLREFSAVNIQRCDFADFSPAAGDDGPDLITMVAVLHHLDLDDTLGRIARLLAPGGRLLVVGLARADSPADLAFDVVSAAANPVMGMIKHPRPVRQPDRALGGQPAVPMMDPATTLAQITTAARAHLPGSTLRRRLFFRYTLRWEKPFSAR